MREGTKMTPVESGAKETLAPTKSPAPAPDPIRDIIVRSPALKSILTMARRVASHNAAVLIVGETGSGKEMIARTIHDSSLRCNNPWIDVNCAAIPEHLVESELFGYEKGAFSGADHTKPGFFELAHRGTLFLDEVGDLDPKIQVKLLRVLDGVAYYRLGGSKKVEVDVRVVAATNQNLEDLIAQGKFRRDLFHRLSQFQLNVPPLRERPEDIMAIAEHLLHHHFPESRFTADAVQGLLSHPWPGNIRELKSTVFRAVMQAPNAEREITAVDLKLGSQVATKSAAVPLGGDLENMEKQMILSALERAGGNQGKAAEQLGISRRTLSRKLKAYRMEETPAPKQEMIQGSMAPGLKRYFRVDVKAPLTIRHKGQEIHGSILNVSSGGIAISADQDLSALHEFEIEFTLPEMSMAFQSCAQLAWADNEGRYGVQFVDMLPAFRSYLERWITSKLQDEGWALTLSE